MAQKFDIYCFLLLFCYAESEQSTKFLGIYFLGGNIYSLRRNSDVKDCNLHKKWQRLSSFKKNIFFRPYLYFIKTNNNEMQLKCCEEAFDRKKKNNFKQKEVQKDYLNREL